MHDTRLKCQQFASVIQTVFEKGLHVSQDSQHFILSTFSISDIHELETLITDPSSCESDSLIEVIEDVTGIKQARKYKVWLRNMVTPLGKRDSAFIKDLFLKMGDRTERFHEYLYFALRFLEESQNSPDPLESLMQYKQRCLRHLQQNDRLEAYRRKHNMETLMAHGIRIPHLDKQALLLRVTLVDDICLALFNRSM